MTTSHHESPSEQTAGWRWRAVLLLPLALLIAPVVTSSAFSNQPISFVVQALLVATAILFVFSSVFPPRTVVHGVWIGMLALLIGLTALLAPDSSALIAGGLAMAVLTVAFAKAYAPISRLALTDLWLAPGNTAVVTFFAFFALSGLVARFVVGDSQPGVVLSYVCLGAVGLAVYALLARFLTSSALVAALLVVAIHLYAHYASQPPNLAANAASILLVAVAICLAVFSLERHSAALMMLTGVASAIATATNPSLLLFPLLFVVVLGIAATPRRYAARFRQIAAYVGGVAVGAALTWQQAAEVVRWWRQPSAAETGAALPPTLVVWLVLFTIAIWLRRVPRAPLRVLLVFAVAQLAAFAATGPAHSSNETVLSFHLAMILGASFLLPRWGLQWWRQRPEIPRRLTAGPRVISVVLPTYNEKDSIRGVIEDFFATGIVSEVLVINNNAVEGTSEEVAGTGAREIFESRQGYGAAIRRGLVEAKGELICVCEPDGTFLARDIVKLVAFADDFDVVYGSRTSQILIWEGANMGVFLRWGNWAVAKYMQFLYNATNLTDVGCTMRLLRREVAERLRDKFRIEGSQFGPEMMVLSLKEHFHVIQVPVNYLPRVGESAVTGDPSKAFWLGLQMIWLITKHRFEAGGRDLWSSRGEKPSVSIESVR